MRDGIRRKQPYRKRSTKLVAVRRAECSLYVKEIAQIEAQGELNAKNQMVNTIADVSNNYYNIVRQKQQLNAIREQMGVAEARRPPVGGGHSGKTRIIAGKGSMFPIHNARGCSGAANANNTVEGSIERTDRHATSAGV